MGDMADLSLEYMCDVDEFGLDGFDKVSIDPDTLEVFPCSTPQPKTCRCCRETNLHWEISNNKWRLFDDKGLHICKVNPLEESNAKK